MTTFIFDFDGTLADSKQCSILATQAAFVKHNLTIPSVEIIEYFMGIPIEVSFKEMTSIPLSNSEFDALLVSFREAYQKFEMNNLLLFPHIIQMLDKLQQHMIRYFVLSSKKTDVLARNLLSLGISQYFEEAIGSDKVTAYKPNPAGIQHIIKKYSIPVQDIFMIGDAIFDIQMGNAAHVKTCAVNWGSHTIEQLSSANPSVIIHDPLELIQLISD